MLQQDLIDVPFQAEDDYPFVHFQRTHNTEVVFQKEVSSCTYMSPLK